MARPFVAARNRALTGAPCPPLHESFIRRPRLVDRLVEDREASLVLLAAPPGYGKTSTLSEWAERGGRPFAFVALGEADDRPDHLLAALAVAVEHLQRLDRRFTRGAPHAVTLTGVMDALAAVRPGAVLMLDDVHHLRSPEALGVLAELLSAVPPGVKLALTSRTAPLLSLARLRAQHKLLLLGAHELAMTSEEAATLLAAAGLELPGEALELAMARTEGWPAALYLLAMAVRDEPDATAALGCFSGEDELVAQYIREELLAQMAPADLTFLMETAVLDELAPELCDALLDRKGSGLALRAASERTLLVRPIDRGHRRYRCHPLLREVLQAELSRADSGRAARFHGIAARWLGEHGQPAQALRHAGTAGDLDQVGRLLWAQASRAPFEECGVVPEDVLSLMSPEQIASVPTLALSASHCALMGGDARRAAHWARIASGRIGLEGGPDTVPGFAAGLAVIESALSEDLESMAATAANGYALAEEASPWRAACRLLSGVAQHLGGERLRARATLSEGARYAAVACPGTESHCLSQLAVMAGEDEDWETATELVELAAIALARSRLSAHPTSAAVLASSAWVCSQRGRADEAKRDLDRSRRMLSMLEDFIPWYGVQTRVLLARTAIRLTDVAFARAQLSEASRLARRMPNTVAFRTWLDDAWGKLDEVSADALGGSSSLTMAELRILRFLPTHLSFREIGGRLHVSTNTVKSQVHAVYRKLDAVSRSEAVEHASALGLIDAAI